MWKRSSAAALDNLSSVLAGSGNRSGARGENHGVLNGQRAVSHKSTKSTEAYYFPQSSPPRSCVIVAGLPLGALIEN
jgi:hypothetical protein